jgi:hypothetical protein
VVDVALVADVIAVECDARQHTLKAFERFAQAYADARRDHAAVRLPRMYLETAEHFRPTGEPGQTTR